MLKLPLRCSAILSFGCVLVAIATLADSQVTCRNQPLDVIFILDGSRSVRPKNFRKVKAYVKNFTTIFEQIGPDHVQIGLIQYGSIVREEIKLKDYQDKDSLMEAIDKINYMEKGTMTGDALKYLVTKAMTLEHGARLNNPLVDTIVMIITDGRSQDYGRGTVTEWQRKAKAAGVEIYSIGVGRRANDQELTEMASMPKASHKFHVGNFDAIHTVDLKLHDKIICDVDECANGNHSCSQICQNTIGSYLCRCNTGFTLLSDARTCLEENPCRSQPCSHFCNSTAPGRFQCSCPESMKLESDNITCVDFDECLSGVDNCDQVCINTVESYRCDCHPGFQLEDDGFTCTETNPCLSDPCSHKCSIVAPERFVCGCPNNMELDDSDLNCVALPLPTPSNLRFSRITHTSARAKWDIGDFDERYVDRYVLVFTRADGVGENTLIRVENRTADLVDLDPFVKYNVSVSAVTRTDFSPAAHGNFTTLQMGDTVVTLSNATLTSLTANWEPAGGDGLTGYEISCQQKQDPNSGEIGTTPEVTVREVNNETNKLVFYNLDPGTPYVVRVTPLYGELRGKNGMDEDITDSLMTPNVSIVNTTFTTVHAKWEDLNYPVDTWTAVVESEEYGTEQTIEVPGDEKGVIFGDLRPSTGYHVRVIGNVMSTGDLIHSPQGSAFGATKSLTAPQVEVTNTSLSTLTVEWQAVNLPVDSWTILVFPNGQQHLEKTAETGGDKRSHIIERLRPSTLYLVEVLGHAYEFGKHISSLKGLSFGITKPAPPTQLNVLERGFTYIFGSFQPSPGAADGYEAECVTEEGRRRILVNATISELASHFTFRCENLTPATQYIISVRTIYKTLASASIKTIDATLTPPPIGLELFNRSAHTLLVRWIAPTLYDDIDYYILSYDSSLGHNKKIQVAANKTSFLLEYLLPSTEYEVNLKVVMNGKESAAIFKRETTLADNILMRVDEIGAKTINISWTPSKVPHVLHYLVNAVTSSRPNLIVEFTVPRNQHNYSIRKLRSATTYKVQMAAVYGDNVLSDFSTRTATTLALPPIGPLEFSDVSSERMRVSWGRPTGRVTPLGYVVTYFTEGSIPITVQGVTRTFLILEDLNPATTYNVTVFAAYTGKLRSASVTGNATTFGYEDEQTCSCTSYLREQAQMQNTLEQLVQQIDILSTRINQLTTTNGHSGQTINSRQRRTRDFRHTKRTIYTYV